MTDGKPSYNPLHALHREPEYVEQKQPEVKPGKLSAVQIDSLVRNTLQQHVGEHVTPQLLQRMQTSLTDIVQRQNDLLEQSMEGRWNVVGRYNPITYQVDPIIRAPIECSHGRNPPGIMLARRLLINTTSIDRGLFSGNLNIGGCEGCQVRLEGVQTWILLCVPHATFMRMPEGMSRYFPVDENVIRQYERLYEQPFNLRFPHAAV